MKNVPENLLDIRKHYLPQEQLEIIANNIKGGSYDWTSKRSIIIYGSLLDDFEYITLEFKLKEKQQ